MYARERALGQSPREAARRVHAQYGTYGPTTGAATRLEACEKIQARIRHMRALDDEMLAMKRERIERRLMLAAECDLFQFSTIDPATGKPVIDWVAVMASDYRIAISEFAFDPDTGALTKFKRDDVLSALNQLRNMYGFEAPKRHEMTGKGGGPMQMIDLTSASDEQLAALESVFGPLASASGDAAPDPGGTDAPPAIDSA